MSYADVSGRMDGCIGRQCRDTLAQYARLWPKSMRALVADAMARCQRPLDAADHSALVELVEAALRYAWERLNAGYWKDVHVGWRRLYTVLAVCKARALFGGAGSEACDEQAVCSRTLLACDMGLIMGAPLPGDEPASSSLARIAQSVNAAVVDGDRRPPAAIRLNRSASDYARRGDTSGVDYEPVDRLRVPSVECFVVDYLRRRRPLLIAGAIEHWEARRKWSVEHIYATVGRRSVPVEVGGRYTDDDWSQSILTVKEFVLRFMRRRDGEGKEDSDVDEPVGYVAQHQLFGQLLELAADISVPDYCYTLEDDGGDNGECEVDVNAWLGPAGTVSPLHHDPRENVLAQVFGSKRVRLVDPRHTDLLYAHSSGSILTNTSQVDIERPDLKTFPSFADVVVHDVQLDAGDMLYIPKGWWHHVRSLSESFSVSFWFGPG